MVAIYARQSVFKEDSISIESQIEYCQKAIGVGKFQDEDVDIFVDRGFSGANTNRPEFKRMMEKIDANEVTMVAVYKLDRISRSVSDFMLIYNRFCEHNVQFFSVTDNFDTSTVMGKAMLQISAVFAEMERSTIKARISDNYYARAKKGMYLGGPAPFGFDKEPACIDGKKTSKLVPNQQADTVIRMFHRYSEGGSLGDIVKWLASEDVESPKGRGWDTNRVGMILRNPVYVKADADVFSYFQSQGCIMDNPVDDYIASNGCFVYGNRKGNERKYTDMSEHHVALALHEGIVDAEVFLRCQSRMAENKQLKNSGKGQFTWLSGIAKCLNCGMAVRFTSVRNSDDRYAHCSGKSNKHNCDGLGERVVFMHSIEHVVEQSLLEHMQKHKSELLSFSPGKLTSRRLNDLKIQRKKLDEQSIVLLNELANPEYNDTARKVLRLRLNECSRELDAINRQVADEESKLSPRHSEIVELYELAENWDALSLESKKAIARCFISRVLVSDSEIKVEYSSVFST